VWSLWTIQTLAAILQNKQYFRPRGHAAKAGKGVSRGLWLDKRAKNGVECVAVKFELGGTSSDVPRVAERHVGELRRRNSQLPCHSFLDVGVEKVYLLRWNLGPSVFNVP
jgi:hypothetical protein